jgi:hypothetical protein
MEKVERTLLDVVALSTVVIAIGSLGIMVAEIINTFGEGLLPKGVIRVILVGLSLIALYYTIASIMKYHATKKAK